MVPMNQLRTAADPLARADGSPLRILVVDDEESLTDLLAMAMRYEGWQVTTADTGTLAVRRAREFQPDAIVLDMMLPDLDGLEVLRRVRAADPEVPVLFLTARDAVADRVSGLTAGGDTTSPNPSASKNSSLDFGHYCAAPAPPRPAAPRSWSSGTWCWTRAATTWPAAANRSP